METAVKILAVDDEPSIAQSMHFIFDCPRYQVTSAQDGDDALAQLAADPEPFDVVITDSKMPHVSGVELVRELRDRSFPGKIMVLSAYLTADTRAAYEQMAVDVMIEKPFNIHGLRDAMDTLVARA